jgi:DNA-binding CsgD family transcriptional regulator
MNHPKLALPDGVVECTRLLADVAALNSDPPTQRQALIDGLMVIFQAKLGWFFAVDNWLPGLQPKLAHQVLNSDAEPIWLQYMAEFSVKNPPDADPYSAHALLCNDTRQIWPRSVVLPDAQTEKKYQASVDLMNQINAGDGMVLAYRHGFGTARVVGFAVHRDKSQPKFTPHEQALALFVLDELADMEDRRVFSLRGATTPELPPRLEQVLDRVLTGKEPKEIANELRISLHTLREHLQRLYKHFDVSSREELMARYIGAGNPKGESPNSRVKSE